MELKNAVSVCLIALFSATLMVLIARWLDSQAASRLEPQLIRIVEELQALRKQGLTAASPGRVAPLEPAADGLVVYYFHSNTRCPTCEAIESQSHEAVQANFGPQLSRGEVAWKVLNYEQPSVAPLTEKFEIIAPVVVLARITGGQVQKWKRLDKVWALVGDKPAFIAYVRDQIKAMLEAEKKPAASAKPPLDLPIPSGPPNIPIPK